MQSPRKFRNFVALAALRLRQSELADLHYSIASLDVEVFIELIRDIEDELDSSVEGLFVKTSERASYNTNDDLYRELNALRKKSGYSVHKFATRLEDVLLQSSLIDGKKIPKFESRRGLRSWIERLLTFLPEGELFNLSLRVLNENDSKSRSDWRLR